MAPKVTVTLKNAASVKAKKKVAPQKGHVSFLGNFWLETKDVLAKESFNRRLDSIEPVVASKAGPKGAPKVTVRTVRK